MTEPTDLHPPATRQLIQAVKTVGVVLLVAVVGYLLILVQAQQDTLSRRTPTLDYLVCHDRVTDDLSIAIANYMVALKGLVNLSDDAAPESRATALSSFNLAADAVAVAKIRVSDTTDSSLPTKADARPDGRYRCPTAPNGD